MNKETKGLARATLRLDVDKQGLLNSLIDSLGLEGLKCGPGGIPRLADKSRGLTGEMVARVLSAVARRAAGETWQELTEGGDPWCQINPIAQKSAALARLVKAGEEAFMSTLAKKLEDRLVQRAVNPKRRYVTGRVGKDTDGILRHPETGELLETEPDNGKILEFALAKIHPRFRDEGRAAVGQQNIYNITVIPPPEQAGRAEVVDIQEAFPGGNVAGIGQDTS